MNNTLLFLILQKENLFYVSEKETAGQSIAWKFAEPRRSVYILSLTVNNLI